MSVPVTVFEVRLSPAQRRRDVFSHDRPNTEAEICSYSPDVDHPDARAGVEHVFDATCKDHRRHGGEASRSKSADNDSRDGRNGADEDAEEREEKG